MGLDQSAILMAEGRPNNGPEGRLNTVRFRVTAATPTDNSLAHEGLNEGLAFTQ